MSSTIAARCGAVRRKRSSSRWSLKWMPDGSMSVALARFARPATHETLGGRAAALAAAVRSPSRRPSVQGRGRASGCASLRRSALRADCPAVLAPRGDFDNSALGTGPQTRRSRRGVPLQPRCAALLGAAEALRRSPAHGLASTTERLDDERYEHTRRGSTRRRELHRRFTQRRGWAAGAAPLRRRAAQRSGGSPARSAGPARSLYGPAPSRGRSRRHRSRPAERAAQGSRRDSADRRSEAAHAARPRLCALDRDAEAPRTDSSQSRSITFQPNSPWGRTSRTTIISMKGKICDIAPPVSGSR